MSMRSAPKPRLWPYLTPPALLLALVSTGPAFYGLAVASSGPESSADANIGGGLAMLWTMVCGLPWSLLPFSSASVSKMSGHAREALYAGCALLNVGVLSFVMLWLRRRAMRRDH